MSTEVHVCVCAHECASALYVFFSEGSFYQFLIFIQEEICALKWKQITFSCICFFKEISPKQMPHPWSRRVPETQVHCHLLPSVAMRRHPASSRG